MVRRRAARLPSFYRCSDKWIATTFQTPSFFLKTNVVLNTGLGLRLFSDVPSTQRSLHIHARAIDVHRRKLLNRLRRVIGNKAILRHDITDRSREDTTRVRNGAQSCTIPFAYVC
jgi:hypothetical protein